MQRPLTSRILSLILILAMMVPIAACVPADPNNGNKEPSTPPAEPSAHVCVFGEWECVKEATASTEGLAERKCACGETEQKVIPVDSKEYTITYVDAPQHGNPVKYTVNDYIHLQAATWNGLAFAYWSDKDGNVVKEIPYGTEGNITLYANWRLTENMTISYSNSDPSLSVSDGNRYYFIYKIGKMTDVVLDQLSSYKYKGGTSHTWTISETVSFTQANAENIATAISNSVTKSESWSTVASAALSHSKTNTSEIGSTLSAEIGVEGFGKMGGSMSASMGVNINNSSSFTTTNTASGSTGSTSSASKTVASTISFETDTTTQIIRSETLDPSVTPAGAYKYVQAADILVFAIVTYDVDKEDYYIDILSVVQETYDTMLYEPLPEEINNLRIVESEPFAFNMDIDSLANEVIANAYYINFDANGGEGRMPVQMVLPNQSAQLSTNKFTKAGSIFVGWRVKDGDKTVVYMDGQSVDNLGSPKETVTLEAIWSSTEPGYSAWSEWSDWTPNRRETSDLVKEETAVLWSYYYFKCPSCGRHTPYYGYTCNTWPDGCGNTKIPDSSWRWVFSEVSYDQAGLKQWYSTQKSYTTIINGQVVFKASNGQMTVYRYATRTVEE